MKIADLSTGKKQVWPWIHLTDRLNTDAMTSRRILSDRELEELRKCEHQGLIKEDGQWTAYWTDGDYLTLRKTHERNWEKAGDILKSLVSNYWTYKEDQISIKGAVNLIRSASKMELAEIACHVKDEMQIRGMSGWPLGKNKVRKGVRRAKDLIDKYYYRLDFGEYVEP